MNKNENNTLDDILSAAKAEFSEKGFQSASLRRIVKNAGVTTGAFYGYFKSKEELFSAFFEVIIHDIPHENAAEYLEELKAFYTAGWKKIMGF